MKRFLVSILQYDVKDDSIQNFKTLEKLFAVAGGRKSKFVVLPEMFASSFNYEAFEEYSKNSIEIVRFLQNIASKYNFYIIAGSLPIKNNRGNGFFNRSYLISSEGAVAGYYDKNHVFFQRDEDEHFCAGQKIPVFNTYYAPVGIQICFDIRFPENIREMVKKGIQILFVPAQFPSPRKEHWMTLLKARAIENQLYVVGANRIGKANDELSFFGNSVIIDPYGDTLANGYEKEGVISEYIDLEFLEAYRKSFPVLKWLQ